MAAEKLTEKQKQAKAQKEYEEKINALSFQELLNRGLIKEALLRLYKGGKK